MLSKILSVVVMLFCMVVAATQAEPPVTGELAARQDAKYRSQFQRTYARYAISRTQLPALDRLTVSHLSRKKVLVSTSEYELVLRLGARRMVKSNAIFRTDSRYVMNDSAGTPSAKAESIFALEDRSGDSGSPELRLFSDTRSHSYLIAEWRNFSSPRYILFRRVPHAGRSVDSPAHWNVTYLRLPERQSPYPPEHLPHILGLSSGHIYVEQDNLLYAFPIDSIELETALAYSIG